MSKITLKLGDIVRLNSLINYKPSSDNDVYSSYSKTSVIDMTITDIISVNKSKNPNNTSKVKTLYVCTFLNGNYDTHGFPAEALTKIEQKTAKEVAF